jgi:MOSC domain-containing protein YiiM
MGAYVAAVSLDSGHHFSKPVVEQIRLLEGLGVEGDAHLGVTVQHRSRVARDPTQPNLRQVHLIHAELLEELRPDYSVNPGELGENITTRGLDLLALPTGSILRIGDDARVEVTGLRNPCLQINHFSDGLMKAVLGRDEEGNLVRKAGVMGIVLTGGEVRPGDAIDIELPAQPHEKLQPV